MNLLTEKSFHSLVELLKSYKVEISNVKIKHSNITYYIKIDTKDSLLKLEDTLSNVYKILQIFTYPSDSEDKIRLKYEVI